MSGSRIEGVLLGISVLVVDTEPFRRDYMAAVLLSAGALVIGPFAASAAAIDHLNTLAHRPALAYVSRESADSGFLAQLMDHGMSCVAIWSETVDPGLPMPIATEQRIATLRPPLAGFQIVDALAELHRACIHGVEHGTGPATMTDCHLAPYGPPIT